MKRQRVFWAFFLIIVIAITGCTRQDEPTPVSTSEPITLALIHARLIDGTGADPVEDATILIAGQRIAAVGTNEKITFPEDVQIIDLQGATVLPGIINAHVHRGFDEQNLKNWAQAGVTTVRDEGTSPAFVDAFDQWQEKNENDSSLATLISAGSMIGVPGGYGSVFIHSAEEGKQVVLNEQKNGVQIIKVCLEDGYAGKSGLPKLSEEEITTIVLAAHEHGLRVSAHITDAAYIQPFIDAGVDDIAHDPYNPITDEQLAQMVEKKIALVPTFTVFRNYGAPLEGMVDNLKRFISIGGIVALGNDFGGGPGDFENGIPFFEFEQMQQSGMTPMQILVASTKNAALVSNIENEVGTVEAGKIADLLIVEQDPLKDLNALKMPRMVIHNGQIIRDTP